MRTQFEFSFNYSENIHLFFDLFHECNSSFACELLHEPCCYRGGEEASCTVPEDCVEYAHYDTHIRNEEIYQDLCSIDKQSSPAIYVSFKWRSVALES